MTIGNHERPARVPAYEHCTVARESGELAGGILLNLSEKGFGIQCRHALAVGERIELRIPGLGRFSGIVRWIESNHAGGVLEPFDSGGFEPN